MLSGEMKEQALAAVREIVAALPDPDVAPRYGINLAGGTAGIAILCAYLSRAGFDMDENATQFLNCSLEGLATVQLSAGLYDGFTGIAWTLEHLKAQLLDNDDHADPNDEIDRALLDYLNRSPWIDDYELMHGLVGFGIYAFERWPRPSARECLSLVLDRLTEIAERTPEGMMWRNPPYLTTDKQSAESPAIYNLGLAHGIPCVIAFLGAVCTAGIEDERVRPLLDGAISWLLRQRREAGAVSCFAGYKGASVEDEDCRLAWCYGDAGIASALLLAARATGNEEWKRTALELALHATRRSFESTDVKDAILCHGAAGLGHVFNRLSQATGDEELDEAARVWFGRALAMRQEGKGIGGFLMHWRDENGVDHWDEFTGLLMGVTGIALCLLAAATAVEPEWDRIMLLSTPELFASGKPPRKQTAIAITSAVE